ncbi:MAG: DUF3137 domain-containing protein [Desulfobacterales bacterium]|nr:DUF3137 domain-containing protein [Desulfobacterales bacterium]
MKTREEFQRFYASTLVGLLAPMEAVRKKTVARLAGVILVLSGLLVAVFLLASRFGWGDEELIGAVVVFALLVGLCLYFFPKEYVENFKTIVIPRIIGFVHEGLAYHPDRCIPRSSFMASRIFLKNPDEYTGDDLVSGKIGATAIRFSEIDASYETTQSGKDNNTTRKVQIFKGLFIVADFNKKFAGQTVVLPDALQRLFGRLGKKIQGLDNRRGRQVNLEDPEFEKYFEVYGDDQITARYILSTSLMERITRFRKETKKAVALSFVDSLMYIAVPYQRNLFEPRLFRSLLNFRPMCEYFDDFNLAIGVVEEMNLNRRIWGKAGVAAPVAGAPEDAGKLVQRAARLFREGHYRKAIAVYAEILAMDPEHTTALFNRGVVNKKMGNFQSAYGDFKKAAGLGHAKSEKIIESDVFKKDSLG